MSDQICTCCSPGDPNKCTQPKVTVLPPGRARGYVPEDERGGITDALQQIGGYGGRGGSRTLRETPRRFVRRASFNEIGGLHYA